MNRIIMTVILCLSAVCCFGQIFSPEFKSKIRELEKLGIGRIPQGGSQQGGEFFDGPQGTAYKQAIFEDDGTGVAKAAGSLGVLLDSNIIPEGQKVIFNAAKKELAMLKNGNDSEKGQRDGVYETILAGLLKNFQSVWDGYENKKKAIVAAQEDNPLTLAELKEAKIILLGENHSYRYPSVAMVKNLIEYNKTAPEGEKITNLFLEFDNSVNFAYAFIRENITKMTEEQLISEAVNYGREKFENKATPEQLKHWVYLSYLIAKDAPEVFVYAYDANGNVNLRNDIALCYIKGLKAKPEAKAVFIAGAGHIIKSNMDKSSLLAYYDSAYSIANKAKQVYNGKEIISAHIIGGKEWLGGRNLFGKAASTEKEKALERLDFGSYIQEKAQERKMKNFILKLNPQTDGFDFIFHFDPNAEYM